MPPEDTGSAEMQQRYPWAALLEPRCSPHPFPASPEPAAKNCNCIPDNRGVTKTCLCGHNQPSPIYVCLSQERAEPGKPGSCAAWWMTNTFSRRALARASIQPAAEGRGGERSFPFGMDARGAPQAMSPRAPFPVSAWLNLKSQKCHFTN